MGFGTLRFCSQGTCYSNKESGKFERSRRSGFVQNYLTKENMFKVSFDMGVAGTNEGNGKNVLAEEQSRSLGVKMGYEVT